MAKCCQILIDFKTCFRPLKWPAHLKMYNPKLVNWGGEVQHFPPQSEIMIWDQIIIDCNLSEGIMLLLIISGPHTIPNHPMVETSHQNVKAAGANYMSRCQLHVTVTHRWLVLPDKIGVGN